MTIINKKYLFTFFALFVLIFNAFDSNAVSGKSQNYVDVQSYIIDSDDMHVLSQTTTLQAGQSIEIHSVSPYWSNLKYPDVWSFSTEKQKPEYWETSDPRIATVINTNVDNEAGNETAIVQTYEPGIVTITVWHNDIQISRIILNVSDYIPMPRSNTIEITHVSSLIDNFPSLDSRLLVKNNDNSLSYVVVPFKYTKSGNTVSIITYYPNEDIISKHEIQKELDYCGTFYAGEKYNYLIYGDHNLQEDDNKEVIRIVKYDKHFKRLDHLSIYGSQISTIKPFEAGNIQ